jgi:hypothetical protein
MPHPTMRPHLFLIPTLCLPLVAQDSWEAWAREALKVPPEAYPVWFLARREGVGRTALFSEELLPTRVLKELRPLTAPAEALRSLGARSGTKPDPDWALLTSQGQVLRQGSGEPSGTGLLEALEADGWSSRWDRRQAFLKEHPDQGDALLDAAAEAQRRFLYYRFIVEAQRQQGPQLRISWSMGEAPDPASVKALATPAGQRLVLRPCQQALRGVRDLPLEDPESADGWTEMYALAMGGIASQEALLEDFRGLVHRVEDQLRRDPGRESLWQVWRGMAAVLPGLDAEVLASSLEPAPGSPWPLRVVAEALTLKMDPRQRLDRAEAELAGGGDPGARLQAWARIKLGALLALDRVDEARLWIQEARRTDRGVFGEFPGAVPVPEDHPAFAGLKRALEEDPPVPHPFVPKGLALVVLGRPAWLPAFEALDRHPDLDAWGRGWVMIPGELTLLHLDGKEEGEIRKVLNLPPGPRWVLIRDEGECLAQGVEAPEPARIAQALRKVGPPLLERLEAFLRTHPDHRQAQEQLVKVLTERMPHPRLELKLAQACARLGEAPILRSADFKPQLPLWEPSARRALPSAEARLRRWPESLEAWMAWMDWQSVQARPASPAELLNGLAVWKSAQRGGPGPLPLDVAAGVAQRLEQAGRWKDLAEWGLQQWDGGWRRAMGWGREAPEGEDPAALELRQKSRKELETLARTTLRALAALGRKADLQRLQSEWRAQDPRAGVEVGRVKS